MSASLIAVIVAVVCQGADEKSKPNTIVDGHTLRIDGTTAQMLGRVERPNKHLSITFAIGSKDAGKSFAFELGQRFAAKDVDGKEIGIGDVHSSFSREPAFRLAGQPISERPHPMARLHDPLTVTLPLLRDIASIGTLEGDLFVSDVNLIEFTFAKGELNSNAVKKVGGAEAKLYLFDDGVHGFEVGFKLKLPKRSHAEALTGSRGLQRDQFLLFATDGGRKFRATDTGRGGGASFGKRDDGDPRARIQWEFHGVKLDRTPDALHLVIPQVDYPKRHTFQIKNVVVPPAPPLPQARPKKIAMGEFRE